MQMAAVLFRKDELGLTGETRHVLVCFKVTSSLLKFLKS